VRCSKCGESDVRNLYIKTKDGKEFTVVICPPCNNWDAKKTGEKIIKILTEYDA